jgi:hypothetical protein
MSSYNLSIEQDLRRILMIERRLAILSISYNQTSMNSLHTDLMTISSKGNLWCLAPKSDMATMNNEIEFKINNKQNA